MKLQILIYLKCKISQILTFDLDFDLYFCKLIFLEKLNAAH